MTITSAIAEHAATAPRAWPDQVRQAALRAVIDTCACMIAGRGDPAARQGCAVSAAASEGLLALECAPDVDAILAALVH